MRFRDHRLTITERRYLAVIRSFKLDRTRYPTARQIELRYERWSHGRRISPGRRQECWRLARQTEQLP